MEASKSTAKVDREVIAAIMAAVMEMGYSPAQIASIRPAISNNWKMTGRILGR